MSDGHRFLSDKEVPHYQYVDCLRAVAIILVLVVHSNVLSNGPEFFFIGQRGVQLFYIVSAFTLLMSLQERSGERRGIFNYFLRRYFRVAPLFYFALIGNLIYRNLYGLPPFSISEILLGVALLHGLSPELINTIVIGGWSVAVEFTFYLFLPFIFKYITSLKKSIYFLFFCIFVCWWVSYKLKDSHPLYSEYFTFMWFVIQFPVFLMGVVSVFLMKNLKKLSADYQTKKISFIIVVLSCLIFLNIKTKNETLYESSLCLMFFVVGISLHGWTFFVNKHMAFVGKISYSMYLLHFFVIIAFEKILVRFGFDFHPESTIYRYLWFTFVFVVVFLVSVPLSYWSWKYIETPFISMGRRIIKSFEVA